MRTALFILMFFVFGGLLIISNNNLAMNQKENVSHFTELYIDWMNHIYINLQSITGNVVKLNWFPNGTQ